MKILKSFGIYFLVGICILGFMNIIKEDAFGLFLGLLKGIVITVIFVGIIILIIKYIQKKQSNHKKIGFVNNKYKNLKKSTYKKTSKKGLKRKKNIPFKVIEGGKSEKKSIFK